MQLETLRDFIFLADNLSFSETAKQLYVSQSVLSKRIAAFEGEIGAVLFVRDKHSVRLTVEGKLLSKRLRKVLAEYDAAIKELDRMKRSVNSLLKVGYIHGACHNFLPHACYEFSKKNPETELELYSMEADQVIEALGQNEIDIGITTFFRNCTPEIFEYHTLFKDTCGILVPPSHHLAKKVQVVPNDLKGETLLIPSARTFPIYSRFVRNALKASNYQLDLADDMFDISMVLPFLATERGIALTMQHLASYYGSNFVYIPLDDSNLNFSIVAIWKKAHEKHAIKEFVECVNKSKLPSA